MTKTNQLYMNQHSDSVRTSDTISIIKGYVVNAPTANFLGSPYTFVPKALRSVELGHSHPGYCKSP